MGIALADLVWLFVIPTGYSTSRHFVIPDSTSKLSLTFCNTNRQGIKTVFKGFNELCEGFAIGAFSLHFYNALVCRWQSATSAPIFGLDEFPSRIPRAHHSISDHPSILLMIASVGCPTTVTYICYMSLHVLLHVLLHTFASYIYLLHVLLHAIYIYIYIYIYIWRQSTW